MSRWEELVAEAAELGYTVELVEYIESADSPGILGAGMGVCIYARRLIRIRERLREADRCWVLEHELLHARSPRDPAVDWRHYRDEAAKARKRMIADYLYPGSGSTVGSAA